MHLFLSTCFDLTKERGALVHLLNLQLALDGEEKVCLFVALALSPFVAHSVEDSLQLVRRGKKTMELLKRGSLLQKKSSTNQFFRSPSICLERGEAVCANKKATQANNQ